MPGDRKCQDAGQPPRRVCLPQSKHRVGAQDATGNPTVGSDSKAQDRHGEQEGEKKKRKHKSTSYLQLAEKLTVQIKRRNSMLRKRTDSAIRSEFTAGKSENNPLKMYV